MGRERKAARDSPGVGRPSAEEEAGERASPSLQGWLICEDSARTARLAQIRDLREGSGRPQGPSRPTFPDSLGSMALLSVARADPATASRPPPPPAAWPENAVAATTLGTGTPGGEGAPAGRERGPEPAVPGQRGRRRSRSLERRAAGTRVAPSEPLYGSSLARGGGASWEARSRLGKRLPRLLLLREYGVPIGRSS